MSRLETAYARIDAANGEDPNCIELDGHKLPAELVYGRRMTAALSWFLADASEYLRLAVRAQHIRRWTVPRSSYPMDRPGYLRWRKDLQRKHADWAGEILAECGYSDTEIARVGSLIRKENIKTDLEAQTLEDVASLVFLEHYAADFAGKHEVAKVAIILAKTLAKMSARGRDAARNLDLVPALKSELDRLVSTRDTASRGTMGGGTP